MAALYRFYFFRHKTDVSDCHTLSSDYIVYISFEIFLTSWSITYRFDKSSPLFDLSLSTPYSSTYSLLRHNVWINRQHFQPNTDTDTTRSQTHTHHSFSNLVIFSSTTIGPHQTLRRGGNDSFFLSFFSRTDFSLSWKWRQFCLSN